MLVHHFWSLARSLVNFAAATLRALQLEPIIACFLEIPPMRSKIQNPKDGFIAC